MAESTEIQVARMEERIRALFTDHEEAKQSRKDQYETNEQVRRLLHTIDSRLSNVENSLAKSAPTIEEFITIKHKVVGAGKMGKVMWAILGGALTMIITLRTELFSWLRG